MASKAETAMDAQRATSAPILQLATEADILDAIEDLIAITQVNTPIGITDQYSFVVGPGITVLEAPTITTMPWFRADIRNDGPNAPLYHAVNCNYFPSPSPGYPTPTPVFPTERVLIELGRDMIKTILLTTTPPGSTVQGGKANIRVFATK